MKKDYRSVIVKVGEMPYVGSVGASLESMQKLVGGLIEIFPMIDDNNLLIICNEEGKLCGMEGNRMVNGDIIAGDFFILAEGEEGDFCSLTDEQVSSMIQRFSHMEAYTKQEVEDSIFMRFIPM